MPFERTINLSFFKTLYFECEYFIRRPTGRLNPLTKIYLDTTAVRIIPHFKLVLHLYILNGPNNCNITCVTELCRSNNLRAVLPGAGREGGRGTTWGVGGNAKKMKTLEIL